MTDNFPTLRRAAKRHRLRICVNAKRKRPFVSTWSPACRRPSKTALVRKTLTGQTSALGYIISSTAFSGELGGRPRKISDGYGRPRAVFVGQEFVDWPNISARVRALLRRRPFRANSADGRGRFPTGSGSLGRFPLLKKTLTGQTLKFGHPLLSTAPGSAGGPRFGPAAGRKAAQGRPRACRNPGAATDRGRARNDAKYRQFRQRGAAIFKKEKAAGLRPAASFFFRFIYLPR